MAIRGFKEIIDKKGFRVNAKDRAIFEREIGKSYFGLGISDMIEFIVYDSNDNQLPQGDSGQLVRYIPLDVENIRKYFLITQNKSNMKMNGADEYIIDIEKLITEAGYSNGIFKSQVSLLNRRVGSETIDKDKLWIHEISPSRTEIRVLPMEDENEVVYDDLQKRLNILLNGKNFRDDTIYFVKSMVESIKVDDVLKTFLTLNGTVTSGENYVKLIQSEFKVQNWELFVNQIKEKLVEGAQYFVENRDWNISSNNYGKPLSTPRDLELSVEKIVETLNSILIKVIDKYLPKRTYQEENILTVDEQITLDEVKQLLKTVTSGTKYDTDAFDNSQFVVKGCTNPNAKNYNPLAQEDDGSCIFDTNQAPIPGAQPTGDLITKTWYAWKDSSISFKTEEGLRRVKIFDGNSLTITYYKDTFSQTQDSDVRETPKDPRTLGLPPNETFVRPGDTTNTTNTTNTATNQNNSTQTESNQNQGDTMSGGGGGGGQTTTTGEGFIEITPGQYRGPGFAVDGGRRPRGAQQ